LTARSIAVSALLLAFLAPSKVPEVLVEIIFLLYAAAYCSPLMALLFIGSFCLQLKRQAVKPYISENKQFYSWMSQLSGGLSRNSSLILDLALYTSIYISQISMTVEMVSLLSFLALYSLCDLGLLSREARRNIDEFGSRALIGILYINFGYSIMFSIRIVQNVVLDIMTIFTKNSILFYFRSEIQTESKGYAENIKDMVENNKSDDYRITRHMMNGRAYKYNYDQIVSLEDTYSAFKLNSQIDEKMGLIDRVLSENNEDFEEQEQLETLLSHVLIDLDNMTAKGNTEGAKTLAQKISGLTGLYFPEIYPYCLVTFSDYLPNKKYLTDIERYKYNRLREYYSDTVISKNGFKNYCLNYVISPEADDPIKFQKFCLSFGNGMKTFGHHAAPKGSAPALWFDYALSEYEGNDLSAYMKTVQYDSKNALWAVKLPELAKLKKEDLKSIYTSIHGEAVDLEDAGNIWTDFPFQGSEQEMIKYLNTHWKDRLINWVLMQELREVGYIAKLGEQKIKSISRICLDFLGGFKDSVIPCIKGIGQLGFDIACVPVKAAQFVVNGCSFEETPLHSGALASPISAKFV